MTALHGKAAIVGGSSAGIGYAIARAHRIRMRGDWRVQDSEKVEDRQP